MWVWGMPGLQCLLKQHIFVLIPSSLKLEFYVAGRESMCLRICVVSPDPQGFSVLSGNFGRAEGILESIILPKQPLEGGRCLSISPSHFFFIVSSSPIFTFHALPLPVSFQNPTDTKLRNHSVTGISEIPKSMTLTMMEFWGL